MTNIDATMMKLAWALDEAIEWGNWFRDDCNYTLAEYWDGRAKDLLSAIQSRAAFEHAARTQ